MNSLRLPPEVLAIRNWLTEEFYRILIGEQDNNIYIINALREHDDDIYEIKIKYNSERNTALLTIHGLKEINPKKYYFCLELLNYLNIHTVRSKFSLNPKTMILSCSQILDFANWEVDTDVLTDWLYKYTCWSIDDLSTIVQIFEEDIDIVQAVDRSIGDVFVFLKV